MATGGGIQGYTWHHSHIPGEFQLVDTVKLHKKYTHTGGDAFWGGTLGFKDLDPKYNIKYYTDILFN